MKKIIFTLATMLVIISSLLAQYRCMPSVQSHGNPGGMDFADYQNASFNWYYGTNVSDTPTWQPVQHLNFPFYFNGQLVTSFKASNGGMITFDTATILRPVKTNVMLPSPLVPNKSICINGGRPVKNKTQVTYAIEYNLNYPNMPQQLWITFVCLTDTGATSTYLRSIVLEDSTNNIYIVDQGDYGPVKLRASEGIQLNSSTAFSAPGSPNLLTRSNGSSGYSMDNFYYAFIPGAAPVSDGSVTASAFPEALSLLRGPFTVKAKFKNLGSDTVHSLQLHYTINGASEVTQTFQYLNVANGFDQWLVFNNPFSPNTNGTYQLDMWADNLSTGTDADASNDHYRQTFFIADSLPNRRLMCEQFKATWCGNSGYWTVDYDTLLAVNATKATNIHYEQLELPWNGSQFYYRQSLYKGGAIPLAYVNGKILDYPGEDPPFGNSYLGNPWNLKQAAIDSLSQLPGYFYARPQLTITNNVAHITGWVKAAITLPANKNCRYLVALVEDSVVYAQPQGNSYETHFKNTMRIFLPTDTGVFIGYPVVGHTDTFSLTYTITDTSCHPQRLRAYMFVQDTLTNEIYQSAESDVLPIPDVHTTVNGVICHGDTGVYNNNYITGDTSFVHIYRSSAFGDSIVTFNINALPAFYDTVSADFCAGQSYMYNYNIYNSPGQYHITMQATSGCDSMITLMLTQKPAPQVTLSWNPLITGHYFGGDTLNAIVCLQNMHSPIQLTGGNPAGGYYSGQAVIANVFYPNQLTAQNLGTTDTIIYTYTASNGCSNNAFNTVLVTVCESTSQLTDTKPMLIYPNPANNQLFIKTDNINPANITIYDADGRIISTLPFKNEIDISTLSDGIYFIELTIGSSGTWRQRFVKM